MLGDGDVVACVVGIFPPLHILIVATRSTVGLPFFTKNCTFLWGPAIENQGVAMTEHGMGAMCPRCHRTGQLPHFHERSGTAVAGVS